MININKLENMVAEWLKPLPHLPANGRKWIAENVWWITLIGVILSVIGALAMFGSIFAAMAWFGIYMGTYTNYVYTAPVYSGWAMFGYMISMISMVITFILMVMAVNPLKRLQKKGWMLLFYVLIIQAVVAVLSAVFTYSLFGFINGILVGAISVAISAYLLYEIRSYFVTAKK